VVQCSESRDAREEDAARLTIITGGIRHRPSDRGGGPARALEVFKTKMGLRFDAGPAV
jgi:hypothetical protein